MAKKEWSDFKDRDYLIIIPSKERHETIVRVQELFPNAVFLVHESEYENYAAKTKMDIITHKKVHGIGSVMNEIFDKCKRNNIRYSAVFDDDKWFFQSLVGSRQRNLNPEQIEQSVVNACQVLEDLDCYLYLFSTASSIIKYSQAEPFKVGFSLPQGALVHRNEKMHRYKEGIYYHEDFDWCMEYVKRHRFYVMDMRTLCISKGLLNTGGCNSFRTTDNRKKSVDYILKKWGKYVSFRENSSGVTRPTANIKFKQKN